MIILSTADNHIGFKQYGLKQREKDIENSFWKILEMGVKENAAAVTVSGDLLHSIRPTASTVSFLKKCQEFLVDHNLPCLVSEGNHDKSTPHWITNISSKDDRKGFVFLDNRTYEIDGFKIFGNSFTSKEDFDKGSKVPEGTDLLLMHQQFCEFANFPNEKLFDCGDLDNVRCPLIVVGDIHITDSFICRYNNEDDSYKDIRIYSPGSSELMSESESDTKYILKIDTDGDTCKVDNIPIATRPVLRVEVRQEDCIEKVIEDINSSSDEEPMVFLKFNTSLENVISRIRTATRNSGVILRPKPIMEFNGEEVDFSSSEDMDVTLVEVLQDILPEKSPVFSTVSQLICPEADVVTILDTFVETRMKELKNVNT